MTTTPEAGATFRLEYDKYFDGTEMEALDPEAFAGASGKAVLPVKAVTTGNATELLPESLGKLSGSSSNLLKLNRNALWLSLPSVSAASIPVFQASIHAGATCPGLFS